MELSFSFTNKYLLNIADFLTKQHVMKYHALFNESQWWPRQQLKEDQSLKLQKLILIAEREVPFYRDIFRQHNVTSTKIKSIEDITKLPIVTKKQLKAHYPHKCVRKTGLPEKEYFTSGSSGNPFCVRIDNISMSQARALMILRANYSGWEIGNSVFQTGMSLDRGFIKKIKDILFRTYYASAFNLSDEKLDEYLEVIDKARIEFLMGYPGSIYALAIRANQLGYKKKMKGIVTWGDNLYDHFRKTIESQFKTTITDTYGCGEGIQIAAQCPSGNGNYHIFMPHVIVEVVGDDKLPVKRGQYGHILLTKLEPGAMPLIRYDIGDIGRMANEARCDCGRGFDSLASIDGRNSDFIYTPKGNRLIVHFFTGIFEYYTEVDAFQVIQKSLDNITIIIVPGPEFCESILGKVKREILEKGDEELKIEFKISQKINTPKTGKRQFVISEIYNEHRLH